MKNLCETPSQYLSYEYSNYCDMLQYLSKQFGVACNNNTLTLPDNLGVGNINAFELEEGMSTMILDCVFYDNIVMERKQTDCNFFLLEFGMVRFNDNLLDDSIFEGDNYILFSNSENRLVNYYKNSVPFKKVKIIVTHNWLQKYFGEDRINLINTEILNENNNYEWRLPMDATTKGYFTEVFTKVSSSATPELMKHNRALLLIENFVDLLGKGITGEINLSKASDQDLKTITDIEKQMVSNFRTAAPTIEKLAAKAGMSTTKLKQLFRDIYGMPIYTYYQKQRMNQAKKLLEAGNNSIKEIGQSLGFTNLSHFSHSFKKEFNMLPSDISKRQTARPRTAVSIIEKLIRESRRTA